MCASAQRWLCSAVPVAAAALVTVAGAGCDGDGRAQGPDAVDAAGQADVPAAPACEVTAPTACVEPAPRYPDVAPLFAQHCLGCHDGTRGFWPLTSYAHVVNWVGEIRGAMVGCTMPPPGETAPMPTADRERILAWIRCGNLP